MKNIKKSLLSVAVVTTLAFSANAQEASSVSENTTLGSIDNIDAQIAYENKQLALEQAKLQRKQTREELNKNKFLELVEQREQELLAQFKERERELINEINNLQQTIYEMQEDGKTAKKLTQSSIEGVASKVYVTSINGVGSNLTATIYFNETVDKVNAGAAVSDSITVEKVHPNGITISDGGETRFIALTNEKFAFSKTFNQDAAEMLQSQTRSPLSLRGN